MSSLSHMCSGLSAVLMSSIAYPSYLSFFSTDHILAQFLSTWNVPFLQNKILSFFAFFLNIFHMGNFSPRVPLTNMLWSIAVSEIGMKFYIFSRFYWRFECFWNKIECVTWFWILKLLISLIFIHCHSDGLLALPEQVNDQTLTSLPPPCPWICKNKREFKRHA